MRLQLCTSQSPDDPHLEGRTGKPVLVWPICVLPRESHELVKQELQEVHLEGCPREAICEQARAWSGHMQATQPQLLGHQQLLLPVLQTCRRAHPLPCLAAPVKHLPMSSPLPSVSFGSRMISRRASPTNVSGTCTTTVLQL